MESLEIQNYQIYTTYTASEKQAKAKIVLPPIDFWLCNENINILSYAKMNLPLF
jgi:hypothetical protein